MDTTGRTVCLHVDTRNMDTDVNINANVTLQIVITKQDAQQVLLTIKIIKWISMLYIYMHMHNIRRERERDFIIQNFFKTH